MEEDVKMELAESEKFGELECSIYRDSGSGELFFTREQIGEALEYSDPKNAIKNIHARHADRLDKFSIMITVDKRGAQIEPPFHDGGEPDVQRGFGAQETVFYSRKGVMEICRWSRQPKANAFMDWVWEVTDRLMSGEAVLAPGNGAAMVPTGDVCAQLDSIADALSTLDEKVSASIRQLDEKVSMVQTASSYSNYYLRCQMRSGYDERWEHSQRPRLKAIAEFIGIDEKRILREIYAEMERRYGITLDSFVNDYKRTKGITTCSTLSVISFSLTLREMFNAIVDEVLAACGIDLPESLAQSRLLDMVQCATARRMEQAGEP